MTQTATLKNGMRPTHPGEVIVEMCMKPVGMDIMTLSMLSGIKIKHIKPVTKQKAPITDEIAQGLAKAFSTSTEIWTNLQRTYDLRKKEVQAERLLFKSNNSGLSDCLEAAIDLLASNQPYITVKTLTQKTREKALKEKKEAEGWDDVSVRAVDGDQTTFYIASDRGPV